MPCKSLSRLFPRDNLHEVVIDLSRSKARGITSNDLYDDMQRHLAEFDGEFEVRIGTGPDGTWWTFRFTDANTAFWFKMKYC